MALAAETFGVSQLMGGSDFPYFQEEKYVRAFDYVRTSRFADEEKKEDLVVQRRAPAQALPLASRRPPLPLSRMLTVG
ncbi:hypothetical protein [Corynebacterium pyruviciproducens]|uniref:hypothetical protein n=1 Tax=Corynebacterium pyruviciproducens TaxID=598660 RepID=UPI0023EF757B|nr:hypothetical protein [Corynebacterium pyruviciproducens]